LIFNYSFINIIFRLKVNEKTKSLDIALKIFASHPGFNTACFFSSL
jgi:hypothetical protein